MREAVPGGRARRRRVRRRGPGAHRRARRAAGLDRVQLHGAEPRALVERSARAPSRGVRDGDVSACRTGVPVIYDRPLRRDAPTSRSCTRTGGSRARSAPSGRVLLAGALDAGQRRRRRCAGAPVRRRRAPAASRAPPGIKDHERVRRFVAAAKEAAMSTAQRGLDVQHAPDALGRFGEFGGRFVPETVMAALDELEAALAERARRPRVPRRSSTALGARLRRPPDAALPRRAADRARSAAPASGSSARTSTTPARTRSTTPSARRCSRGGSASSGSSPRPAPASTASRRATVCARFGLDVRRLHGRGGHPAPGAQRHADAPARRRRRARSPPARRRSRTP